MMTGLILLYLFSKWLSTNLRPMGSSSTWDDLRADRPAERDLHGSRRFLSFRPAEPQVFPKKSYRESLGLHGFCFFCHFHISNNFCPPAGGIYCFSLSFFFLCSAPLSWFWVGCKLMYVTRVRDIYFDFHRSYGDYFLSVKGALIF